MTKQCLNCSKEFEYQENGRQEKKYCSKSCRYQSAYKRRENHLAEKLKGQIFQETKSRDEEILQPKIVRHDIPVHNQVSGLSFREALELATLSAELKAENKRLNDKIEQLQRDYNDLELEFELLESKSEGEGMGGIGKTIGELMPLLAVFMPKSEPSK